MNHSPIKTIAKIKPQKTDLTIISLLKVTMKSETRVEKSYKKKNLKYQIHLRAFSFYNIHFSLTGPIKRKKNYIYMCVCLCVCAYKIHENRK